MPKVKKIVKDGVELDYISNESSIKFVCDICHKEKVAKKYAEYSENGIIMRICNNCYGWKFCK